MSVVLEHDGDADPGGDGTEADGCSRADGDTEHRGQHDDEQHRADAAGGERSEDLAVGGVGAGVAVFGHDVTPSAEGCEAVSSASAGARSSTRRRSWALRATTMVEMLIKMAANAEDFVKSYVQKGGE